MLRLAFCLDGLDRQVGVAVRQPEPDRLSLEVVGDPEIEDPATLARWWAGRSPGSCRSTSTAATTTTSGGGTPVVGRIQAARPGLRPPLFYSAYEAALWGILSARQPAAQMFAARDELAHRLGRVFVVAGQELAAAPLPRDLAGVAEIPGVRPVKIPRLQALGRAAADGELDTEELRGLDPEAADVRLRRLPGIGPFYAELIIVRALGHTDVLAGQEPRLRQPGGRPGRRPGRAVRPGFRAADRHLATVAHLGERGTARGRGARERSAGLAGSAVSHRGGDGEDEDTRDRGQPQPEVDPLGLGAQGHRVQRPGPPLAHPPGVAPTGSHGQPGQDAPRG